MKQVYIDWSRFSSYVGRALQEGAMDGFTSITWDVSSGCYKPHWLSLTSHPPTSPLVPLQYIVDGRTRWIHMATPCRKCESCLKNRQKLWKMRMRHEIKQSNRTWMLTFTISPDYRFMFSLRSGSRNYHDSFKEIAKEFTKYLKRLRKAGYKFRYIMVAEAHKDGYPHLHALMHEVSTAIPKRRLQSEWPYGFTTAKLVKDERASYYVAKYLAKDARTRIRASQLYGQSVRDLSAEFTTLYEDSFSKKKSVIQ